MNKQFELLEFVFNYDYADLKYNEISLTYTSRYVCFCGVSSHMVGLVCSVRLYFYPMWKR